jgi:hypothetical protein
METIIRGDDGRARDPASSAARRIRSSISPDRVSPRAAAAAIIVASLVGWGVFYAVIRGALAALGMN